MSETQRKNPITKALNLKNTKGLSHARSLGSRETQSSADKNPLDRINRILRTEESHGSGRAKSSSLTLAPSNRRVESRRAQL
jgi:hypothetical protein